MTASPGSARSQEIVSKNPSTLEELARFRAATAAEVSEAVARARAAQPAWASISCRNRARYVSKVRRLLYDRQDQIIKTISDETGKPPFEALATELFPAADLMSYYASRVERVLKEESFLLGVLKNKRSRIVYDPLGVIGVITPWNFPFAIPVSGIVAALIAGNSVVFKPSEYSPLTAQLIVELFEEAGFPEGVLEIVLGDRSTGEALVESQVDKIIFTGSVAAGRKIAERAAGRLLPVVLELGGKDPMIVCEDAPLERAARGAVWGAFANCGQVCASVERLYVMKDIADKFISCVLDETRRLRVGEPIGGLTDVGPLANEAQLNKVISHVEDAVARGAQVQTGGRRKDDLEGFFYEPTVLTDVNSSMLVMTEETFGPILPIQVVKDEEEAIQEANNSRYGLTASVWTSSNERGRRIARRLEAGTVLINDVTYTYGAPETPWVGVKDSGIGVMHGDAGLMEFVRMKHINWDLLLLPRDWWWFPYSQRWHTRFLKMMKYLYRWGLRKLF